MNMTKYNAFCLLTAFILGTMDLYAQCPGGQVNVTIDVTTDAWGYECFWDLTPSGNGCGNGALFSFGNVAQIGCGGAGAQVANGGGYPNNTTTTETIGCQNIGSCFDINYVDDWGDGGATFVVNIDGIAEPPMVGSGTGNIFSFCITSPSVNDATISAIAHEYTKVPLAQAANIVGAGSIASIGSGNLTGVTMTVDVTLGASNVYSATTAAQNVNSGANANYSVAGFTPTAIGIYTVTYTATINETDEDPSNNTTSYSVEVTDSIYARDNGIKSSVIGIGAGETGYMGNIFTINNATKLSSVSVLIGNGSGNITGNSFSVEVFTVNGMGTPVTSLATATGTIGATPDQWYTINVSPVLNLPPGDYLLALKEDVAYQQQIGYSSSIITPSTSWVSWASQPWATTEALGFNVVFMIRGNMSENAALSELSQSVVQLYPNPAANEINISTPEFGTTVYIYDAFGHKVMEHTSANDLSTLNIAELENGSYIVKLISDTSIQTSKFIKR